MCTETVPGTAPFPPKMLKKLGTRLEGTFECKARLENAEISFCTGDFAPPKPEFVAEFWEADFGRPNFGPEILGSNLFILFFQQKLPADNSPSRNSPPKIRLPKCNPEIGPKNSHCTSAGPLG